MTTQNVSQRHGNILKVLLIVTINLCVASIIISHFGPVTFIPSDDQVYARIVGALLENSWAFAPEEHFYLKPLFLVLNSIVYEFLSPFLDSSPLWSIAFTGVMFAALSVSLLQIQVIALNSWTLKSAILCFGLSWFNTTIWSTQLWWGYGSLMLLIVCLTNMLWVLLSKEILALNKPISMRRLCSLSTAIFLCHMLGFYTHIAILPFFACSMTAFVVTTFCMKSMQQHGDRRSFKKFSILEPEFFLRHITWRNVSPLVICCALALASVATVIIADVTSDWFHSIHVAYEKNLAANSNAIKSLVENHGWSFRLTIPVYAITAEGPLMAILVTLGLVFFSRQRFKVLSVPPSPTRVLIMFNVIFFVSSIIMLSVLDNTKLLRNFAPIFPSIILVASVALQLLFTQGNSNER